METRSRSFRRAAPRAPYRQRSWPVNPLPNFLPLATQVSEPPLHLYFHGDRLVLGNGTDAARYHHLWVFQDQRSFHYQEDSL